MHHRTLRVEPPFDLCLSLRSALSLPHDPTQQIGDGEIWRTTRTPAGAATLHLRQRGAEVLADAWGPGAEAVLDSLPALVGLDDEGAAAFRPLEEPLRTMHRRCAGLRVARSGAVFEAILPVIVTQRVIGKEAGRAYRRLLRAFGEAAPGPHRLLLPPSPQVLANQPYEVFHPFGIEKRRADTIRRAAAASRRLEEIPSLPRETAWRRLLAIPGVGLWTAAKVMYAALGDADAVHLGDYHLPSLVAWNLAGEPRADDDRMLELLEPWVGQRGRVVRLLEHAGRPAPRFGPRLELRHLERS